MPARSPGPDGGTVRPPAPWLYGPGRDLLLGCGLGYVGLFAVLLAAGPSLRALLSPVVLPLLTLVFGAPHYGATLVRVYAEREDRRAYAFFAVWVSLALLAAFVAATRSPLLGSLLITVYVTWSPWHYSGQNYGIAVLFLRRAGVPLPAAEKRALHASFLLSFALTVLAVHGDLGGAYAPGGSPGGDAGYRLLSVGIPSAWTLPAMAAVGLAYLAVTVFVLARLAGRAPAGALAAVAALVVTQALWFSVPVAVRTTGVLPGVEALGHQHAVTYFFWIALGHVVQYLWVTSYYAQRRPGFAGHGRYFLRCLLAGLAIFTVPALLFAPGVLGTVPFGFGLGALVAAVVNLHHFVLDGAVWKLRDGRIARILVRPVSAAAAPEAASRRGALGAAVAVLGVLALAVNLGAAWEIRGVARGFAEGDLARVRASLERLRWLGRDNPATRMRLASALAREGDAEGTLAALERTLELLPEAAFAWFQYAAALEQTGRDDEAFDAYQEVLARDPERADAHFRVARIFHLRGDRVRALAAAERAVALAPDVPRYRGVRDELRALAAEGRAGSSSYGR